MEFFIVLLGIPLVNWVLTKGHQIAYILFVESVLYYKTPRFLGLLIVSKMEGEMESQGFGNR